MSPLNPLNPATGNVPVPNDRREVGAALRAGRVTYRIYPYFEWRFGERGRKFTHSDSAWLAWLTRFDQARVDQDVDWLRGLLANRGMPSPLLETHLRLLDRELTRTVPSRASQYARLANAADRLRRAREEMISAERERRLVDEFVDGLGQGALPLVRGVAKLLVASVADEKVGVVNAVSSLRDWLADVPTLRRVPALRRRLDPSRRRLLDSRAFERTWHDAIERTVEGARHGGERR